MPFPLSVASFLFAIHTPNISEAVQINAITPTSVDIEIYRPADAASVSHHQRTVICRDVTPLNTKVARRVCHTKAEWDRMAIANKRAMERFSRRF